MPPPPPVKPRSQVPGKLNMSEFQQVTSALAGMQMGSPRSDGGGDGYAVPRDRVPPPTTRPPPIPGSANEYAQPIGERRPQPAHRPNKKNPHRERREQLAMRQAEESDSPSLESSTDEDEDDETQQSRSSGNNGANARRGHHHQRKKPPQPQRAIAVATPKAPSVLPSMPPPPPQRSSTVESDKAKFDEVADQPMTPNSAKSEKDLEKQRRKLDKEMKQRAKDAEKKKAKDEKKRLKDEKKKLKSNSVQAQLTLDDFRESETSPVPLFLSKAIGFIEKEGLDAEGLYRVPGNRAHVDLLFQKFDEDRNVDIESLDIAVNAVATAVKDFFFKRLPPVLDSDHMAELESISSKFGQPFIMTLD